MIKCSSAGRMATMLGLGMVLISSAGALGQEIEYEVFVLPEAPDSLQDIVVDINNHGEVVGRATYPHDPFFLRAWLWTPTEGFSFLPAPPGQDSLRYAATAISDTGYIAGDGGGDSGIAWRYKDGEYTLIGALPGEARSIAVDVNDAGDVAGYSGFAFDGTTMFKYSDADGLVNLTPNFKSRGGGINNAGVVVGGMGFGTRGFRVLLDGTIDFFKALPGEDRFPPRRIMDSGMIVGSIVHQESSEPYYYTDAEGMVRIPAMERWNGCVGVSDDLVFACSTSDSSGGYVWSAEKGARWLSDLIDPALKLQISRITAINGKGQMVGTAATGDFQDPWVNIVLTPINRNPVLSQTALIRGERTTFSVTNAVAGDKVYFLYTLKGIGNGTCPPFFGGLCIDLVGKVNLIGTNFADASGNARKSIRVPANVPLIMVHTQAVAQRGVNGADSMKSNTLSDVIRN